MEECTYEFVTDLNERKDNNVQSNYQLHSIALQVRTYLPQILNKDESVHVRNTND